MSPAARRKSVAHVRERFWVSERRACRVIRIARSSQRYRVRSGDAEAPLTHRMVALATRYGRYGYRRITALLRQEGWRVNHKRVERIWRREGLESAAAPAQTRAVVVERWVVCAPATRISDTTSGVMISCASARTMVARFGF